MKTLPGIFKAIATNIVQSRQTAGNIIIEDLGNLPDLTVTEKLLDRIDWEVNPDLMVDETQTDVPDINPKRPCPFCMTMQSSWTKHIQQCHQNEEELKAAMSSPRLKKTRAFRNMKKQGIFKNDANIMETKDVN